MIIHVYSISISKIILKLNLHGDDVTPKLSLVLHVNETCKAGVCTGFSKRDAQNKCLQLSKILTLL